MIKIFLFLSGLFIFTSCNTQPQPINYNNDACNFCRMTIVDQRYGTEVVTKKGKVYKFDSIECMVNFIFSEKRLNENEIHSFLVTDFSGNTMFVDASSAYFLQSKELPSPMGMFLSAFKKNEDRYIALL